MTPFRQNEVLGHTNMYIRLVFFSPRDFIVIKSAEKSYYLQLYLDYKKKLS